MKEGVKESEACVQELEGVLKYFAQAAVVLLSLNSTLNTVRDLSKRELCQLGFKGHCRLKLIPANLQNTKLNPG